ncbi:phasin family protein [Denitromonas sp.]|uniref:phasin family protein n=1 Tax=Denitromonas sp. TaxID=2734609 RepID=UPI002B0039E3|nr:phasin family protein [Denitromonas sp.]
MSNTQRDITVASTTAAVDAFLALSSVYWTSVEDISALNLKTARETLDDYASAAKALSAPVSGKDYSKVLSGLGQPMYEKALDHSRSMRDIMTRTQREMSAVLTKQLARPPVAWAGAGDWNELSSLFAKGIQQFTARSAENFSAASDATDKVIAATTSAAKRAA